MIPELKLVIFGHYKEQLPISAAPLEPSESMFRCSFGSRAIDLPADSYGFQSLQSTWPLF